MSLSPSRREFCHASLLAAAGSAAAATLLEGREPKKVGPNDRIGLGFIGLGGMGTGSLKAFQAQPDVNVVAVCDVYAPHREKAVELTGKAKGYEDFRKLLERPDVDAVVVSTPDHWHALASLHALRAKKHVYCEKPLTHTVAEGRAMVAAAREQGLATQMGIQIHAGENYHQVVDVVRSGVLGKISKTRVWCNRPYVGLGKPPDSEPPAGLNWDLWLGPAPEHRFNPNRFLFNWRWFRDYGGGLLADMGCHVMDLVHWAMQVEAPLTVTASGGRYVLDDNTDVPDTMEVIYEYPGFLMTWSHTMASSQGPERKTLGIQFHGTEGTLTADYGHFELTDKNGKPMPPPKIDHPIPRSPGHHRDWLDAIKNRRRAAADFEYGHRLSTLPHLGNIARDLGRKLRWDARAERFVGDEEANQRLFRTYREPWKL